MTVEQKQSQYKTAKSYLKGRIDDIEIETISQAKVLMQQFRRAHKNIVRKLKKKIVSTPAPLPLENCENEAPEEEEVISPVKKILSKRAKKSKTSLDKNLSEEDIKNLTTNISIGDDSTIGMQTESDCPDFEKKSFFVCTIPNLEKNESFSHSNTYDERELPEDSMKFSRISDKRYKPIVPSKYSLGSRDDLPEFSQKILDTKSLNYLHDMSPRSPTTNVIRTENDLRHPRRKFRQEAEKIQDLKLTLNLINKNIHQAKSMLDKQLDAYQKKGYSIPMRTVVEEENFDTETILTQSCQNIPESIVLTEAN